MSIKTYKLVPIAAFAKSDLNRTNTDGGEVTEIPKRSVRSIIEDNLENTDFNPSTHHVAEQKYPQQGGGGENPLFLPNTNILPQFSKGSRIKKSYDDTLNILNDDSLSDDLKIKLYTLMRHKYNAVRRGGDGAGDGEDEEFGKTGSATQQQVLRAIRDIADNFPPNKQPNAYKIINVLLKNKRYIDWDIKGYITHPITRDVDIISHMKNFLVLLLYQNKGGRKQIELVAEIVRPFYRDIEKYVTNEKVRREMESRPYNVRLSKYVAW